MSEQRVMPDPILQASVSNMSLDHLVMAHENGGRASHAESYHEAPWLLGYRIPHFQRAIVWTDEQCVRFIESAWLGLSLGTYVVNRVEGWANDKFHPFDRWLIDGQQRLTAVKRYLDGDFAVFGWRYPDLPAIDRRRFGSFTFAQAKVTLKDEAKLRELYNRMAFGGTPHREEERA